MSKKVIEAGISHHRFAAALYFFTRGADDLFIKYIELASNNQLFFNDKHQALYQNRHDPEYLKHLLSAAA